MPNTLPDNLLNRFSRIYVSENSFDDKDTGKKVEYKRFVLEFLVKGEPFTIELPVTKTSDVSKKDIALLALADVPENTPQAAF